MAKQEEYLPGNGVNLTLFDYITTQEEAKELLDSIHETFPELRIWIDARLCSAYVPKTYNIQARFSMTHVEARIEAANIRKAMRS